MSEQSSLLSRSKGGMNVFYKGRYLYSDYAPSANAEKTARAFIETHKNLTRTLFIVPSPLLWYGFETLVNGLGGSRIICTEADPGLLEISRARNPEVPVLLTHDITAEMLSSLPEWPFRRVVLLPLSGGYRSRKPVYDALRDNITGMIQEYWQNRITMLYLVPLWIKNIFRNLTNSSVYYPLKALRTDKPVLLVGAGPSMESLESFLRINNDSIFLLVIDTALPWFIEKNIKPDAILAVDGQFYNFLDFVGSSCFSNVPLIMDITLYPGIVRLFKSSKYVFCTEFWETGIIDRLSDLFPDRLDPFGSVGIAGLEIAQQITNAEVFFTGLDFCYLPGKTHARGTTFTRMALRNMNRLNPSPVFTRQYTGQPEKVYAIDGSPRLSDSSLLAYKKLLEKWKLDRKRIFALSGEGLDTGFIVTESGRVSSPARSSVSNRFSTETSGSVSQKKTRLFAENEKKLLERLYETAYTLLSTADGLADFIEAYESCSYTGLHIPDMDHQKPHPAQLKRLLVAAGIFMKTLGNATS